MIDIYNLLIGDCWRLLAVPFSVLCGIPLPDKKAGGQGRDILLHFYLIHSTAVKSGQKALKRQLKAFPEVRQGSRGTQAGRRQGGGVIPAGRASRGNPAR